MRSLYSCLLIFVLLNCLACQDFLDVKPANALEENESWEGMEDFARHWRGVYATLNNAGGFTEAARIYGDIQCDLAYSVQGYNNVLRELYQWNFSAMTTEVEGIYYAMWKTIAEINNVFDHVPDLRQKIHGQDSIDMEYMLGDMYMLRALCYSKLVEYYCEAYDPVLADMQLGMPICESAVNIGMPERASLKETYEFMYRDLEKAVNLLSPLTYKVVTARRNFLCSSQSAEALWARIALNQKQDSLAAAKAESALQSCLAAGMRLDIDTLYYGNLFRGSDAGEELLFYLGMRTEDVTGSVGSYFCDRPYGYYHPQFVPSEYLLDLYEDNDVRYSIFFELARTDYSHGLQWPVLLKEGHNPELDISSVNYAYQSMPKLFRLSELYLIIAEANAVWAGGDLQRGNEALSTLRETRIYAYQKENYDAATLLREVKTERARELCFEGFRLSDLKRWGDGFRRHPQPYTTSPDNELIITPDNKRFTWPIPKHELEVNPNMKPNKSN